MVFASTCRYICALAVIMAGLSGCVGQTQIEPPPKLDMPPKTSDRLTQVTIKNGAGEVIFDGAPARFEETSIQPDGGTFDGTLQIAWETRKGKGGTQTLTHDPSHDLDLDFDWDENEFEVTGTPRLGPVGYGFDYTLLGGYVRRNFGAIGAFTDKTADETALLEVDDADGFRLGGRLTYGGGMVDIPGKGEEGGGLFDPSQYMVTAEYWKTKGDAFRTVVPGAGALAVTFPFEVENSTGLDFGQTGGEASLDYVAEGFNVELSAGFSQDFGVDIGGEQRGFEIYYNYGLFAEYNKFETFAHLQNLTFSDIMSRETTDVHEFRAGPTLGAEFELEWTDTFRPYLGTELQLYGRTTNLDGVQQTWAPGILTPAQQEPLPYDDDDSGIGARIKMDLGFKAQLTPRLSLDGSGFYWFDSSTSFVDKKDNPTDDANQIDTDGSHNWGVQIGAQYKF